MTLKLYADLMSQPSRAIYIFCKANNISFELENVRILKGDHMKPEFSAINPLKKLPAISDAGFNLAESHAILKYLIATRSGIPDHWYPADVGRRATIDSVLDWHHANLRRGSAGTVMALVLAPRLGRVIDAGVAKDARGILESSLNTLEQIWLQSGPLLAGALAPSIADLSLACELTQLEVLPSAVREEILGPFPRVQAWLGRVESTLAPHFADGHRVLRTLSEQLKTKAVDEGRTLGKL